MKIGKTASKLLYVSLFALLGFLVMGYHPGYEDDGVYLASVKAQLQPALYPHDSGFFRLQMQATLFDEWMAGFVRVSRLSLPWAELLWQLLTLFAIVWSSHTIASQLFASARAQWAGVALLASMFTLPVSGTALNILDQHLHPRNVATALILFAVTRILVRHSWQAIPILAAALLMHPIMAAMGASFCFFLFLSLPESGNTWHRLWKGRVAGAVPLAWAFEPPSPSWRQALDTRTYYFIYKWTWYEWLGALAPLVLFWLLGRIARRRGNSALARFAFAVAAYGVFQQAVAIVMLTPAALVRLTPLQPMRYLQLVYLFMALISGCLLGEFVLKARTWRWAIFLLAVNGGMFLSQRALLAASQHLELPGRAIQNPWLQAFEWVRLNTPADAYFALDPVYLAAPGEDYHSFRALAERSQLADGIKDTAVVTQIPQLAPRWAREQRAQMGWRYFHLNDFKRLKSDFGVDWVLVRRPAPDGLACVWQNGLLSVCQIP